MLIVFCLCQAYLWFTIKGSRFMVKGEWWRVVLLTSSLPLDALDVKLLNVKSIVFFFKRTRMSRISEINGFICLQWEILIITFLVELCFQTLSIASQNNLYHANWINFHYTCSAYVNNQWNNKCQYALQNMRHKLPMIFICKPIQSNWWKKKKK